MLINCLIQYIFLWITLVFSCYIITSINHVRILFFGHSNLLSIKNIILNKLFPPSLKPIRICYGDSYGRLDLIKHLFPTFKMLILLNFLNKLNLFRFFLFIFTHIHYLRNIFGLFCCYISLYFVTKIFFLIYTQHLITLGLFLAIFGCSVPLIRHCSHMLVSDFYIFFYSTLLNSFYLVPSVYIYKLLTILYYF